MPEDIKRPVYITESDYNIIIQHLHFNYCYMPSYHGLDIITRLDNKIRRAIVVEDGYIIKNIIMIHSRFALSEIKSGIESDFVLTLPQPADGTWNTISIFSPLGCAALGARTGDIIECELSDGTTKYSVRKIDHSTFAVNSRLQSVI